MGFAFGSSMLRAAGCDRNGRVGKIVGAVLSTWARRGHDFAHAEENQLRAPLPTLQFLPQ